MSKTKGKTFLHRFGNETKTFCYRSRICLIETRLFRFGPESALLDQIVMLSFDKTYSGTNSNVMASFILNIGTFVERLWNVCFFTVLTLLINILTSGVFTKYVYLIYTRYLNLSLIIWNSVVFSEGADPRSPLPVIYRRHRGRESLYKQQKYPLSSTLG
jgi:hypothetical protein